MSTIEKLVPGVRKISFRYRTAGYASSDHDDLFQEGCLGLLDAASRYEPGKGCSLKTWGSMRAEGAMIDHLRTLSRRSRERPVGSLTPGQEYGWVRENSRRSAESKEMLFRFRKFLKQNFRDLAESERDVIRLLYVEGKSMREAAALVGVCLTTVFRRERRAIKWLKERFLATRCGRDL